MQEGVLVHVREYVIKRTMGIFPPSAMRGILALVVIFAVSPTVQAAEGISDVLRWRTVNDLTVPTTVSKYSHLPEPPHWQVGLTTHFYDGKAHSENALIDAVSFESVSLDILWRPDIALAERWTYAMHVQLPYVFLDTRSSSTVSGFDDGSDNASGLGDMVFTPIMLAYTMDDHWQTDLQLSFYAPTGQDASTSKPSLSTDYWSIVPTVAISYYQPVTGQYASLHASVGFNTPNAKTDYDSGDIARLSATVEQRALLLGGMVGIGLSGVGVQQLSTDSGKGVSAHSKSATTFRTWSWGPRVSYHTAVANAVLSASLMWQNEFATQATTEGDHVTFALQVTY